MDKVETLLVEICLQSISLLVVPEIAKANWEEARPFMRDSRCSYGVQMWNFQLKMFQLDLAKNCPWMCPELIASKQKDQIASAASEECGENLIKRTFGQFLQRSLEQIVNCYGNLWPGRIRSAQFKVDILYIIAIARSFRQALSTQDLRFVNYILFFFSSLRLLSCLPSLVPAPPRDA